MRRLACHVFRLCSAVSLLLSVAACVLWTRSHWVTEWVKYQTLDVGTCRWTGYSISSQRGTIHIAHALFQSATPAGAQRYARGTQAPGVSYQTSPATPGDSSLFNDSFFGRLGFVLSLDQSWKTRAPDGPSTSSFGHAMIPDWFIALVFLTPAAIALLRSRRRRARAGIGTCARCGYDLRASPGRCPECGTPTESRLKPAENRR